jgi:Domain of unknown function (DUF4902)
LDPDDRTRHGYVRVPTTELQAIQLTHLHSEEDPTLASLDGSLPKGNTVLGITEWVGTWRDLTVTVGWDWCRLHGAIVVLSPNEIRTNIQLVAPDGRAERRELAKIHFLHWVESQPWRELAIYSLLAERDNNA